MTLPELTETAIRQSASAESFQRGRDYYQQGAVLSLVQRGTVIQAEVEGGAALPYIVHCTFDLLKTLTNVYKSSRLAPKEHLFSEGITRWVRPHVRPSSSSI